MTVHPAGTTQARWIDVPLYGHGRLIEEAHVHGKVFASDEFVAVGLRVDRQRDVFHERRVDAVTHLIEFPERVCAFAAARS